MSDPLPQPECPWLKLCIECGTICSISEAPAVTVDGVSVGTCSLFTAACTKCYALHYYCANHWAGSAPNARKTDRYTTFRAAVRHVRAHATSQNKPDDDAGSTQPWQSDDDDAAVEQSDMCESEDEMQPLAAAPLPAGVLPEQAYLDDRPSLTVELLKERNALFNVSNEVDLNRYPLSLPTTAEIEYANRGTDNRERVRATMAVALGEPHAKIGEDEFQAHLLMAEIAGQLPRGQWDALGKLVTLAMNAEEGQKRRWSLSRSDIERRLMTGPKSFRHLLPRPGAVRVSTSDGELLEAAVVSIVDVLRIVRGASGATPIPQTFLVPEGEVPDGSASDSVKGQTYAGHAGATTAARATDEGDVVFSLAGAWIDDVTTAKYRTHRQTYSVLLMSTGGFRFPVALGPKNGLLHPAVLEKIAALVSAMEKGFAVWDTVLHAFVPMVVAVHCSPSDRIASNATLWWSQGNGQFTLVAGWVGDKNTWLALPSCRECRHRRRGAVANLVGVCTPSACTVCADWCIQAIPWTQHDVLGNPSIVYPMEITPNTINNAILVVHAAAHSDRLSGHKLLTRASALQYLRERGMCEAIRDETVQRAFDGVAPILHPLQSILAGGFLVALSHQLYLGIMKDFLNDIEDALKLQKLGALFRRSIADLLGDAPGDVSWFQAEHLSARNEFVGSQNQAILRALPWILDSTATKAPGLGFRTVNKAVLELGTALHHLAALLNSRQVTTAVARAVDLAAKHFLDCYHAFQQKLNPPKAARVGSYYWGSRTNLASLLTAASQMVTHGSNRNEESADFANEAWQRNMKHRLVSGGKGHTGNRNRYKNALEESVAEELRRLYDASPTATPNPRGCVRHHRHRRADVVAKWDQGTWIISVVQPTGVLLDWFVVVNPTAQDGGTSAVSSVWGLRVTPVPGESCVSTGVVYLGWKLDATAVLEPVEGGEDGWKLAMLLPLLGSNPGRAAHVNPMFTLHTLEWETLASTGGLTQPVPFLS